MKGKVHSFESFGSVDGPGVRFVVFLSGCGFRCRYCHNPDTWARPPAFEMSAEEVLARALRYREYWGAEGGITVSGGEPMLQAEFLIELFTLAKSKGVHTCLDTAGGPWTRLGPMAEKFRQLVELVDLVLLDLKHLDDAAHRALTGAGVESVLDFARYLAEKGKPVWVRRVLVPGVTDDEAELKRIADFIRELGCVRKVEVLPYHSLGNAKYTALGLPPPTYRAPADDELKRARAIFGA